MMTLEQTAQLAMIITTAIKRTHKELIDALLEQLPSEIPLEHASDLVIGLLSTATFGLGAKMCLESGMTADEVRGALAQVIHFDESEERAN